MPMPPSPRKRTRPSAASKFPTPLAPRPINGYALAEIVHRESLDIHFQPIVSLKRKNVLGVEALARPTDPVSGRPVPPAELFAQALHAGGAVDLDRLCRRKALQAYAAFAGNHESAPLLFLNFEASVLDKGVLGSGALTQAVNEAGLAPQDVVIEINESRVGNLEALIGFVDTHRQRGFLMALDDLGAGFSNLPRIFLLKPDILKLDRALIQEIHKDFHKQEVFRSVVGLGRRVGALILAEGVETEEELSTCMDLGADLIQGFFFAKPTALSQVGWSHLENNLMRSALRLRQRAVHRLSRKREELENRTLLWRDLAERLEGNDATDFESILRLWAQEALGVECLYILEASGMQVTATVFTGDKVPHPRTRLFHPAEIGTDHSNKEYFYALVDAGQDRFMTDTYLSLASGNLCRTLSGFFRDGFGSRFLLCLDVGLE